MTCKVLQPKLTYIIFNAFAKVVRTNGSESQNHGLKDGIKSIVAITIAEMKKYSHHLFEDSLISIFLISPKIIVKALIKSIFYCD